MLRKAKKVHTKCYMITNHTLKFKKHFFLDLAKSGRSGHYLAGTGSEKNDRIDRNRNRIFGRTLEVSIDQQHLCHPIVSCEKWMIFQIQREEGVRQHHHLAVGDRWVTKGLTISWGNPIDAHRCPYPFDQNLRNKWALFFGQSRICMLVKIENLIFLLPYSIHRKYGCTY